MLRQRLITAAVLLVIVTSAVLWLPPRGFRWFVALVILLGAWEWGAMLKLSMTQRGAYLALCAALMSALRLGGSAVVLPLMWVSVLWWLWAFTLVLRYPRAGLWWQPVPLALLAGLIVLVPGFAALSELRTLEHYGWAIAAFITLVAAADSFAYFTGRALGRRALAPLISPNKTWEGVLGGMTGCVVLGGAGLWWLSLERALSVNACLLALLGCLTLAAFSVVGDLFESMFKRYCQVKDSGSLLPGHGGILDRLDSITAAAPLYVLVLHGLGLL
ncbi:MAG: phosphatidate cytidylyltransferase [Pseudomonadales bacterium]|jgi:phosphatidate cytidylyltransferase|nr:phosphatidate cytidylyltransferase [Pseudomonadales bacterium]